MATERVKGPDGWEWRPLGSVFRREAIPVTVEPARRYREIGIRSHGKGVFHKEEVTGTSLGSKRVFEVVPGALVMNIVFAWEGAVAVVSERERGMIASHRFPMYVPTGPVDVEFVRRYFQTRQGVERLGEASPGGAGRNRTLNQKFAAEIPIPMPPLGEQRKVAAILSAVDDAIEATQVVIDQLLAVKRAMMLSFLTRGLPGRHTRFKQTEIGEVPECWELARLQELATVERGKFSHRPRNDPRFFGGKHPFIQTGDVAASGGRIRSYWQTLNEQGLAVSRLFPAGTIVITIAANIGDTGIAMFPVAFPDSLVGIGVGPRIDNRFLELVMRTRKPMLEASAPQNAQKNINLETLRPLIIQVPPASEQSEIVRVFDAHQERVDAETLSLSALKAVRTALMGPLLNGDVRVTPDEDAE